MSSLIFSENKKKKLLTASEIAHLRTSALSASYSYLYAKVLALMNYPMQCRSQVCLKLAQLRFFSIFCSGDFTQFHSVLGPYVLQRNCLKFLSIFSIGGHFLHQSRMV